MNVLFPRFLSRKGGKSPSSPPPARRACPGVETLETRDMPSASVLAATTRPTTTRPVSTQPVLVGPVVTSVTPTTSYSVLPSVLDQLRVTNVAVITLDDGPTQWNPPLDMTGAKFLMHTGGESFAIFRIATTTTTDGTHYTFSGSWNDVSLTGTMTWRGTYYNISFSWQQYGHQLQYYGNISLWDAASGLQQVQGWLTVDQVYQYFITGYQNNGLA